MNKSVFFLFLCAPACLSASFDPIPSKNKLDAILHELSVRPDFGEFGLQSILNLVDFELVLIDHLLRGNSGYVVEKALKKRNKMLHKSVPSTRCTYDMILNFATSSSKLNEKLALHAKNNDENMRQALTYDERMYFLEHVEKELIKYYDAICLMQSNICSADYQCALKRSVSL